MWIVHMRDGRTVREGEGMDWSQLPHQDITSLQLSRHGRTYTLTAAGDKVKLLQLKRALLNSFQPGQSEVTERVIGFIWEGKLAVKMEVDEGSGDVRMTVEERGEKGWRRV